jgi:hypothetical protein
VKNVLRMDVLDGHQQLHKQLKDMLYRMRERSVRVCVCVVIPGSSNLYSYINSHPERGGGRERGERLRAHNNHSTFNNQLTSLIKG